MITMIGKEGCVNCYLSKKKLTEDKIEFIYKDFNKLIKNEKDFYMDIATKNNHLDLPLILNENNELIEV